MNKQHQVVLSLGSNQGNRLENIERCFMSIHREIGTVIKVSRLFETPAWGFESGPFYNCAVVVHTHKSAHQVLDEVLLLEEALGRIRSDVEGYQARISFTNHRPGKVPVEDKVTISIGVKSIDGCGPIELNGNDGYGE